MSKKAVDSFDNLPNKKCETFSRNVHMYGWLKVSSIIWHQKILACHWRHFKLWIHRSNTPSGDPFIPLCDLLNTLRSMTSEMWHSRTKGVASSSRERDSLWVGIQTSRPDWYPPTWTRPPVWRAVAHQWVRIMHHSESGRLANLQVNQKRRQT